MMNDTSPESMKLSEQRLELIALLLAEEMDSQLEIRHAQSGETNEFPLSYAQQQLWFLDRLTPDTFIYNETAIVRLEGKLDLAALEQSFNEIIRRHETLRTVFPLKEGKPVQVVMTSRSLNWTSHDLSDLPETLQHERIQALAIEATQTPFNLQSDLLLRLCLLSLARDITVVLLTIHHIISDGWSMGIFVKELAALYTAYQQGLSSPLPELPIQYRDFTLWQRQWLQGAIVEEHLAYWRTQLKPPLPVLQLPLDHPRPAVQRFRGATHFFRFPAQLSVGLKELERREGSTLFMVLLAAFTVLLHYHSGQDDLIIGTDVANRNRVEVEELIGLFVNQLVLRTDL
ncbi:MAG TPA: condensation domain-containing protein, partial [Ktedonobacteraceae bacterium]|nr:condensation domain-containing protein [Ktedonobacteraceae bacterium]